MRATPGLMVAGLMYLVNRQRGKRRRRARSSRSHRLTFLREHPWAVFGGAASVLAARMWRRWRRQPAAHRSGSSPESRSEIAHT
jgi:hypothetical protein